MKILFEAAAIFAAALSSLYLIAIGSLGRARTLLRFSGILGSLLFFALASSLLSIGPLLGLTNAAIDRHSLLFSSLGGLLYLGLAPGFYHELLALPRSGRQTWVYGAVFGAALSIILFGDSGPGALSLILLSLFLFGEIAWGIGLALARYRSLGSALPRRFIKRFFLVSALFFPALAVDSVGSAAGFALLGPFDDLSLPAFLLTVSVLILLEGRRWTRHLRPPADGAGVALSPAADSVLSPDADATLSPNSTPAPTSSDAALSPEPSVSPLALSPAPTAPDAALSPVRDPAGDTAERQSWKLLSRRETEIAHLLLGGASAKEIASELGISAKTVENHSYRIFQKVGAKSRLQLYRILGKP